MNSIITAFNKVLLSFGNYYHLLENETDIKDKVHRLQVSIQNYSRFTRDVQRSINDLIIDITELLQGEIQRNTSKIITDQECFCFIETRTEIQFKIMPPIKNIKEVSEPLKEQILHGNIHTIDDMRAWLLSLGHSDAINNIVKSKMVSTQYISLL